MQLPESSFEYSKGGLVELHTINQLAAFEDRVAAEIDPRMTPVMEEAWAGRLALKNCICPSKFNGDIIDLRMTPIQYPYERLFDAIERGWRFSKGGRPNNRSLDQRVINSFLGYALIADCTSTSKGGDVIGQLQAELYYGSVQIDPRGYKKTVTNGGASVRRYVTNPKINEEAFQQVRITSREIGTAVTRWRLGQPLPGGMRG